MITIDSRAHAALEALDNAARAALRAPSALNSQPWSWRLHDGMLELRGDRSRQLLNVDPDGRLMTLACGAALHHARISLAADGWRTETDRFPEADDANLLARVWITGDTDSDPSAIRLRDAIARRRTDRRAFGDTPVPAAALDRMRHAAEAEGVSLHVVRHSQMPMLAIATMHAAADQLADGAYRAELARWTNRPAVAGDGVPEQVAVEQVPRRVPMRDHAPGGYAGLSAGHGFDRGAAYLLLFGQSDERDSWLRAGEALSAVLLTAVAEGLSTSIISDAIEVDMPRQLLRGLLAGVGEPYLVVRVGYGTDPTDLPPVPRRTPADAITRLSPGVAT
jgi:nitroreductase